MRRIASLVVAVAVTYIFVLYANVNGGGATRIEMLADYTAFRPWVTRALVPQLARLGASALLAIGAPPDLSALEHVPPFDVPLRAFFWSYPPGRSHNVLQALLAMALMTGFVLLAITSARRLTRVIAPNLAESSATIIGWITPLSLLLLMVGRDRYFGYVYDPATLGLSLLAFALLAERSWRAYFVVFVLATINRETSVYLLLVSAAYGYGAMERRDFLQLAVAQAVTFVAIRGTLDVFALGLGSMAFAVQADPAAFLPNVYEALVLGAGAGSIGAALLSGHPLLFASAPLLPLVGVAYVFAGNPGEIRVFLEVVPVAVVSTAIVASWVSAKVSAGVQFAPRRVAT